MFHRQLARTRGSSLLGKGSLRFHLAVHAGLQLPLGFLLCLRASHILLKLMSDTCTARRTSKAWSKDQNALTSSTVWEHNPQYGSMNTGLHQQPAGVKGSAPPLSAVSRSPSAQHWQPVWQGSTPPLPDSSRGLPSRPPLLLSGSPVSASAQEKAETIAAPIDGSYSTVDKLRDGTCDD